MEKAVVWILRGFAGLIAVLAGVSLVDGSIGGFFGCAIGSVAFFGFAWATRRLIAPTQEEEKSPGGTVRAIFPVAFGGAGVLMLIGAVLFLFDGQTGATIGLGIFGAIFTGVGVLVRRLTAVEVGMKEIAVNQVEQVVSVGGQTGVETRTTYVLVDEKLSPEAIAAQQSEWSERPWTQRKDWVDAKIADEAAISIRLLVGFTLAWNLFSWTITGLLVCDDGFDALWMVGIFPLVGIGLMVLTVRTWLRKRKFGTSVFHCQTVPAWLGGKLQGTVTVGRAVRSLGSRDINLRLVCLRKVLYRARKASDNTESEERIWEGTQLVLARLGGASPVEIPIDFNVPDDQPPTTMAPAVPRTLWRLYVSCEVPGVDYKAVFEVPVFAPPSAQLAG